MRHVTPLEAVRLALGGAEGGRIKMRLARARRTLNGKDKADRKPYIRKYGSRKWSPVKARLTEALGHKCWYTEAELVGADLTIDHYRPSSHYWWLAFDVENYRVACQFANSPKHNAKHGLAGGKGDEFPLLPPGRRARRAGGVRLEKPAILDPCDPADCDLLVFRSDGLPVLNPVHDGNAIAEERVRASLLLLNLDHPDFNTKREQLYHEIANAVKTHEELPPRAESRVTIRTVLASRISARAAFSVAARHYLRLHRHLQWVNDLLAEA